MQQNVIYQDAAIEFTVNCLNNIYMEQNNSHLNVLAKIINPEWSNNDTNKVVLIKLTLYSIFYDIAFVFNN